MAFQAKAEASLREYRARAWLAWHIAALQRAKRLPKLERMMPKKRVPDQTIDEQMAVMRQWKEQRDKLIAMRQAGG